MPAPAENKTAPAPAAAPAAPPPEPKPTVTVRRLPGGLHAVLVDDIEVTRASNEAKALAYAKHNYPDCKPTVE